MTISFPPCYRHQTSKQTKIGFYRFIEIETGNVKWLFQLKSPMEDDSAFETSHKTTQDNARKESEKEKNPMWGIEWADIEEPP